MELIEVLAQKGDNVASFLVNNGTSYVNLVVPNGEQDGLFERPDGGKRFTFQDNIVILSIGCELPLGFEFYDNIIGGDFQLPSVGLKYIKNIDGLSTPIKTPSSFWLPFGNYEMNLGIYNEIVDTVGLFFWIKGFFNANYRISMVNVPDSLNGETFYVPLFLKILHTIELTDHNPPPLP